MTNGRTNEAVFTDESFDDIFPGLIDADENEDGCAVILFPIVNSKADAVVLRKRCQEKDVYEGDPVRWDIPLAVERAQKFTLLFIDALCR